MKVKKEEEKKSYVNGFIDVKSKNLEKRKGEWKIVGVFKSSAVLWNLFNRIVGS